MGSLVLGPRIGVLALSQEPSLRSKALRLSALWGLWSLIGELLGMGVSKGHAKLIMRAVSSQDPAEAGACRRDAGLALFSKPAFEERA